MEEEAALVSGRGSPPGKKRGPEWRIIPPPLSLLIPKSKRNSRGLPPPRSVPVGILFVGKIRRGRTGMSTDGQNLENFPRVRTCDLWRAL